MIIGQKVTRHLTGLYDPDTGMQLVKEGTVIYIHPEGRFFSVEFPMGRGRSIRESYFFRQKTVSGHINGWHRRLKVD